MKTLLIVLFLLTLLVSATFAQSRNHYPGNIGVGGQYFTKAAKLVTLTYRAPKLSYTVGAGTAKGEFTGMNRPLIYGSAAIKLKPRFSVGIATAMVFEKIPTWAGQGASRAIELQTKPILATGINLHYEPHPAIRLTGSFMPDFGAGIGFSFFW